jgi:hypothetical protein
MVALGHLRVSAAVVVSAVLSGRLGGPARCLASLGRRGLVDYDHGALRAGLMAWERCELDAGACFG